jgi:hypothetical protein
MVFALACLPAPGGCSCGDAVPIVARGVVTPAASRRRRRHAEVTRSRRESVGARNRHDTTGRLGAKTIAPLRRYHGPHRRTLDRAAMVCRHCGPSVTVKCCHARISDFNNDIRSFNARHEESERHFRGDVIVRSARIAPEFTNRTEAHTDGAARSMRMVKVADITARLWAAEPCAPHTHRVGRRRRPRAGPAADWALTTTSPTLL